MAWENISNTQSTNFGMCYRTSNKEPSRGTALSSSEYLRGAAARHVGSRACRVSVFVIGVESGFPFSAVFLIAARLFKGGGMKKGDAPLGLRSDDERPCILDPRRIQNTRAY